MNRIDNVIDELSRRLEETARLTKTLLSEIKDSEADFFIVKTELLTLKGNLEALIKLVKNSDNISIATKLAVLEEKVTSINNWIETHNELHTDINDEIDDINKKLIVIDIEIAEYKEKTKNEKALDTTIKQEQEKAKIQKTNESWKIKWQFVISVIMAIITFILGYFSAKFK